MVDGGIMQLEILKSCFWKLPWPPNTTNIPQAPECYHFGFRRKYGGKFCRFLHGRAIPVEFGTASFGPPFWKLGCTFDITSMDQFEAADFAQCSTVECGQTISLFSLLINSKAEHLRR
jgi:hypothetical protein